jgi:hypothetical protein
MCAESDGNPNHAGFSFPNSLSFDLRQRGKHSERTLRDFEPHGWWLSASLGAIDSAIRLYGYISHLNRPKFVRVTTTVGKWPPVTVELRFVLGD